MQASLRSTHDTGRQATAALVEAQGRAEQAQQEYGRLHRVVTAVNPTPTTDSIVEWQQAHNALSEEEREVERLQREVIRLKDLIAGL